MFIDGCDTGKYGKCVVGILAPGQINKWMPADADPPTAHIHNNWMVHI